MDADERDEAEGRNTERERLIQQLDSLSRDYADDLYVQEIAGEAADMLRADAGIIEGKSNYINDLETTDAGKDATIAMQRQLLADRTEQEAEWAKKDIARDAELAELRKDAARYRFLRDVANPDLDQPFITRHITTDWSKWIYTWESAEASDLHIDAAITAAAKPVDEGEDK